MNRIISDILATLKDDHPVTRIEVSAHWILITSKHSGMASTMMSCKPHGEELLEEAGNLLNKSALELVEMSTSANPLAAGIGIAAINSLLELPTQHVTEINIAEVLEQKGKGKKIVMIGHFPFVKKLRKVAKEVWVIDLQPGPGEYSPEQAPALLAEADILAMTGNTLITKAAEDYIAMCRPGAYKIMMGPTTPLTPLLFEHGMDLLAGVTVRDADMVNRYISQGAAFSQVRGIQKVTLAP